MSLRPIAKLEGLVVQDLPDETLIYNLKKNKAYSLNETAALAWKNCDGTKSIGQIAKEMEGSLKHHIPDDLVKLALDGLKKEGLVNFKDGDGFFAGFDRRAAIKKVGLATMAALPFVLGITAPAAAQIASQNLAACVSCIVDLGFDMMTGEPVGVCPSECAGLMCTCYGNNSCMGIGQIVLNVTCEQCRSVDNPDTNNSWRCE